jgi:lysophospholipase L1-like esterase
MNRLLLSAWILILALPLFAQTKTEKVDMKDQNEVVVVFMGNSIIQGWKQADPDFFSNPKLLNRGIGGQTTAQMLSRFERDVIDVQPKAVLILAGTNDIAGNTGEITLPEIRDNIAEMAQMAMNSNIRVILCSVLPAFDYTWSPGRHPDQKIPLLNELIRELAAAKKLNYLDFFTAMADDRNALPKDLAEDGVHPTLKGYDLMKSLTLEAFKELNLISIEKAL